MKKFLYIIFCFTFGFLKAQSVLFQTHGNVNGLYRYNPIHSTNDFTLGARINADFSFKEILNIDLHAGFGVIGNHTISNKNKTTGDLSEFYIANKSLDKSVMIVAGRYNLNKGITAINNTDFVGGNIQGLSISFNHIKNNLRETRYWFSYINSYLNDRYKVGRIGSGINDIDTFSENKINIGGDVFLAGFDYRYGVFHIRPWLLYNTSNPYKKSRAFHPLMQLGGKVIYVHKYNSAWNIISSIRFIIQYANVDSKRSSSGILLNVDEELKYERVIMINNKSTKIFTFSAGVGFFGSFVNEKYKIFAINDSLRFYGLFMNNANYFNGKSVTGYLFGRFSDDLFDAETILAFGSYSEFTLAGAYKLYRERKGKNEGMGVDLGMIYSYAKGNGLLIFSKFFF